MLLLLARITAYNDWTIDAVAWQLRADAAANVAKFSDAAELRLDCMLHAR